MQPPTRLNLLILLYTSLSVTVQAFIDTKLTGTWSSKSRQVVTGPDFYDPVNDVLREPPLTGISYSFTDDGYYEEAYYRAISNPTRPECPKGIMQWQHGTYSLQSNGSLILTPIASDGRQLLSDPCAASRSSYTRYNQSVLFESYRIYTDSYHGILRLDLSKFDGSPMQPLYILYRPPAMLPTTTLDPTGKASQKAKRAVAIDGQGYRGIVGGMEPVVIERCWWFGIMSMFVGGLMMWCS